MKETIHDEFQGRGGGLALLAHAALVALIVSLAVRYAPERREGERIAVLSGYCGEVRATQFNVPGLARPIPRPLMYRDTGR